MNAAIEQLKTEGYRVREEDVARLSPLSHEHINRLGRYAFTWPEPVASGGLRPLLTADRGLISVCCSIATQSPFTLDNPLTRAAGNVVRKYMLSHKWLFFKGIEHDYLSCARPHSSGHVQTTQTTKPASFLQIGANRAEENRSRYLSLSSD
jgi:hypothetical protein